MRAMRPPHAQSEVQEPPAVRRFTAHEVGRMLEVGILGSDDPYELIDGVLERKVTQNPPHAEIVRRLTASLVLAYAPSFMVGTQLPLGGIVDSLPEPDFSVAPAGLPTGTVHPTCRQTVLLVEVSDASRWRDVRKGEIYAAAGAPEYWRVMVGDASVIVHTDPRANGTWGRTFTVGPDERLALPGIAATLDLAALFRP